VAGLIIANIIVWDHYLQVARYDPDAPNIPAVIWSYFSNGDRLSELWKDLLFGKGLQGSAIYIKSAVFLYLIPLMFWLQKLLPDRLRPLHTNWLMIGLMSLSTFVGLTVLGIAQTENWYWNPITVTCPDGSTVAAEVQGAFGFACHFIIIWIFAGWNSQFDYMKPFGLTGRFGQFMKSVLVFLGLGVLEVYW